MLAFILTLFPILASVLIAALCAYSDFNKLKIPNQYVLIVLGTAVFIQLVGFILPSTQDMLPSLASVAVAGIAVFVLSAVLFAIGLMGAGDSKMMSAYALIFGFNGMPAFLFYMATFGAVLGVTTLLLGKFKPFKQPKQDSWIFFAQKNDKTKVPYGIAILVGVVFSYAHIGFLTPETYLSLLSR